MKFDYIFKNATIIDGSGEKEFISDVSVKDERIINIEKILVGNLKN